MKQNTMFPNDEQGIVLYMNENFDEDECIKAIGKVVGPKNVIFASSISKKRFCIYLSNKDIVDELLSNHVVINNSEVGICRLINPCKNLILSNVSPAIPHEVVKSALIRTGLKIVSPIVFLRSGIQDIEYAHVLSFRRQVLASLAKDEPVPETIIVYHENIMNQILVTEDNSTGSKSKKEDHIDTESPIGNVDITLPSTSQSASMKRPLEESTKWKLEEIDYFATKPPTENIDLTLPSTSKSTSVKRQVEISTKPIMQEIFKEPNDPQIQSTNTSEPQTPNAQNGNPFAEAIKNLTKKRNHIFLKLLDPLKGEIEGNPNKYPFTFNDFINIFDKARGPASPNSTLEVLKLRQLLVLKLYKGNINLAYNAIETLSPLVQNQSCKIIFEKLLFKIKALQKKKVISRKRELLGTLGHNIP